jgi:5-methylcytosine-specific restriction endonuclease McrA
VEQQAHKQTTPTTTELYDWLKGSDLRCVYSGMQLTIDNITVDHRTPIARGGTNELTNLAICSHHMNTAKGSMTEYEFRVLLELISGWDDKGASLLKRLKQGHFG